jgi:hypothetical protein
LISDNDDSKALGLARVVVIIVAHEDKINNIRCITPFTVFQ